MKFSEISDKLGDLSNHISVIGKTNSGKTTFSKMLHENTDKFSIFFNSQDEDVEGYRTHSWKIDLLKEHKKINFIPHWTNEVSTVQLKQIVKDLRKITDKLGDRSRKTRFIIFVDESHEIAPQGLRSTPLHFVFKRGTRYGITGVSITQSPAELDKAIVRQSAYHVIFEVNDFESQYFQAKKIPIEQVKDQLVDSHNFTIYDNRSFLGIFTMDL